jgi:glycosyltransferase involved in cell wall biosynthesis
MGGPLLNLCIVSHFAYGAMAGGQEGHIGGVERQTSLLARWLAARGHRVSLITWNEGQPDGTSIDGVRMLRVCRPQEGAPGLRFFHPRWTSLVAAMSRANAAVYYHNCGEDVTGQVALWCRRHDRRFVYSSAAQADCDARLPLMTTRRERVLYAMGLQRADRIVVQTETQTRMLKDGFGLDSLVIPMPCPEPDDRPFHMPSAPRTGQAPVLWVGRICKVKRPDRFLDLVATCPEIRFELVGPSDDSQYAQHILRRAADLPNLRVVGRVARENMAGYYRRALCLCCTSDFEGFPNTFIEAWCLGIPVVSTWDPDNIIKTAGLGVAATDLAGLAAGVRSLGQSPERWLAASRHARDRYLTHHTVDRVMIQFERVFLAALTSSTPQSDPEGAGLERVGPLPMGRPS